MSGCTLYVQALSHRKAELKEMIPLNVAGKQRLVFEAPSRGLIGFRSNFATLTRGTGILHRAFSRYGPYKGPLDGVRKGVLISMAGQHPACCMEQCNSQPLYKHAVATSKLVPHKETCLQQGNQSIASRHLGTRNKVLAARMCLQRVHFARSVGTGMMQAVKHRFQNHLGHSQDIASTCVVYSSRTERLRIADDVHCIVQMARLHCMLLATWRPEALCSLLHRLRSTRAW